MFEQITIPPYDEKPNNLGVYKDNPTNRPDMAFHEVDVEVRQSGNNLSLVYKTRNYLVKLNFLDMKYFKHLDAAEIVKMEKNLDQIYFDYQIIDFFGFNPGLTEIKDFILSDEIKELLLIHDLETRIY